MAEDKKPKYIEGVGWRYETEHSMLRRMIGHDYHSRCIYMITMTTEGRQPVLGNLRWTAGKPEDARVERTPLGDEVAKCWAAIPSHYVGVTAFPLMVMPDHVHGILFVTKEQECHLGQIVKGFKVGCNKAMRAMREGAAVLYSETMSPKAGQAAGQAAGPTAGQAAGPIQTQGTIESKTPSKKDRHPEHGMLFSPGYQDSVLMGRGQLDNMFTYIAQNPYRLAMKKENPDFFRIVHKIEVQGLAFDAIGNRWLLNRPDRLQVRCHNNTTPENLNLIEKQKEYFLDRGKKGGVVVSPCISAGEKEVARAALDAGVPLVVILENGFPPMYKPPGKYFEACANGLLLMLAPWPYNMEKRKITRSQCLELNEMAYRLSTEPWTQELEEQVARTTRQP